MKRIVLRQQFKKSLKRRTVQLILDISGVVIKTYTYIVNQWNRIINGIAISYYKFN